MNDHTGEVDEILGDLEWRVDGGLSSPVHIRARSIGGRYRTPEIYPLIRSRGTRTQISALLYLPASAPPLPAHTSPDDASDHHPTAGETQWTATRDRIIGRAHGLYYPQDRSLALQRIEAPIPLDEPTHRLLWIAFERWLIDRHPEAERIFTDDSQPTARSDDNQTILAALDYKRVEPRVWMREPLTRQSRASRSV